MLGITLRHRRAIAFRNQLIHRYRRIDHAQVWEIAHVSLPALIAAVTALPDDLCPPD